MQRLIAGRDVDISERAEVTRVLHRSRTRTSYQEVLVEGIGVYVPFRYEGTLRDTRDKVR